MDARERANEAVMRHSLPAHGVGRESLCHRRNDRVRHVSEVLARQNDFRFRMRCRQSGRKLSRFIARFAAHEMLVSETIVDSALHDATD